MASKNSLKTLRSSLCSQCMHRSSLPFRPLQQSTSASTSTSAPTSTSSSSKRAYTTATHPTTGSSTASQPPPPPSTIPQPTSQTLLQASTRKLYPTPSPLPSAQTTPLALLGYSPQYDHARAPSLPPLLPAGPLQLSTSVHTHLTALAAQAPHYAVLHIHGKPYLVTQGDAVRLPFLMHGVGPGDTLRLTRASVLGSREWTLKGGMAARQRAEIARASAADALGAEPENTTQTAHALFKRKPGPMYLDERFFVCRATVLGHESEPQRVTRKKQQRNRRTRKIFSKHKHTIIRIGELRLKTLEDLEEDVPVEVVA